MAASVFYIGMDLGGTTFKGLAITPDGQILGRIQGQTDAARTCADVVRDMTQAVHRLAVQVASPERRLAAVGFGVPGIVDLPAGILRRAPNLRCCEGSDMRALMQRHLTVPFTIENDANAAVLGEWWVGAARGMRHVVLVNLGTGVGGGVIIDGAILNGADGYAGELGHTVVDPNGPPCGCGSQGCLEQFASGTAIARMAQPHYGEITAAAVANAARCGEPPALEVFRQAGYYLGMACANFANLFNPECLVIGGAVADAFDLFIEPLRTAMQARTFTEVYSRLHITPAACGTDAGGFGAAYCAIRMVQDALTS
jgi:glucokinase